MKNILVLANSVMHNKSCIAGKIVETGEWVRLKGQDHKGISLKEQCLNREENCDTHSCTCIRLKNPNILNIIRVKRLTSIVDSIHQIENYSFDTSVPWKIQTIERNILDSFLDNPDTIWGNSSSVCISELREGSLYFLKVDSIKLSISVHKKRKAKILYKGTLYDFSVTAREFDTLFSENKNEFIAYITVSLGEVFGSSAYKLVAGIIKIGG